MTKESLRASNALLGEKGKRALVIFHMNFLEKDRGCCTYFYEIVKMYKAHGYKVDFFTTDLIGEDFSNFNKLNKEEKLLIDNFYLIHDQQDKKLHNYADFSLISDNVLQKFNQIVDDNQYDLINIHGIQWMDLIRFSDIDDHVKIIYTMQDARFVQDYLRNGVDRVLNGLGQELDLISYADEVMCISADEKGFFEKLIENSHFYFLPYPLEYKQSANVHKDIDVLFLAADNPYNLEGILWFINSVCPLLKTNINITICGRIWKLLDQENEEIKNKLNQYKIQRIDFAQNLDDLYARTKLSIAAIFHGTGMKTKTIDSMSRGIPVVATELGVDGFQDKNNSGCLVTNVPTEFADYITHLLDNKEYYSKVVNNMSDYFRKYLSLEACHKTMERILLDTNKHKPIKSFTPEVLKIKLFGCIPIHERKNNFKSIYYLFGIPVLKIKQKQTEKNKQKQTEKKYYFFSIPVLKIFYK